MNIFIFINYLLIPGVMILFGGLFLKKPPKEINGLYGYRTTMSMKNKDTWDFANKAIGKLWFKLGIALFIITVILGFNKELLGKYGLVLLYLQIAALILSIFPVEKKLKENFNKNGTRKKQTKI
ncbi:SdpI family protein [Clostridium sp. LY3-2]|uniref:SdpI family protein n=1 Tax=Clostridium sp. LY3-2 TaxID=2942482 RepID=UPI0021523360|nr:SdpI family protein [Clostridium sp. LY3-2]MCR6515388.1 SdpI family protein [Clostridium sp. LY3-2]